MEKLVSKDGNHTGCDDETRRESVRRGPGLPSQKYLGLKCSLLVDLRLQNLLSDGHFLVRHVVPYFLSEHFQFDFLHHFA
jgi:hypothetical protein